MLSNSQELKEEFELYWQDFQIDCLIELSNKLKSKPFFSKAEKEAIIQTLITKKYKQIWKDEKVHKNFLIQNTKQIQEKIEKIDTEEKIYEWLKQLPPPPEYKNLNYPALFMLGIVTVLIFIAPQVEIIISITLTLLLSLLILIIIKERKWINYKIQLKNKLKQLLEKYKQEIEEQYDEQSTN